MSDKNIKIIEHIQKYGHPLRGDKMTDQSYYNPYKVGGYQPKPLPDGVKLTPPNTGSNLMSPNVEQKMKIYMRDITEKYTTNHTEITYDELERLNRISKDSFGRYISIELEDVDNGNLYFFRYVQA